MDGLFINLRWEGTRLRKSDIFRTCLHKHLHVQVQFPGDGQDEMSGVMEHDALVLVLSSDGSTHVSQH